MDKEGIREHCDPGAKIRGGGQERTGDLGFGHGRAG